MDFQKIYELIVSKLTEWMEDIVSMFPNLVLASIVLIIGFFISKWIGKKTRGILKRITKIDIISNLFGSVVYAVFLGIVFLTVLRILNLDKALGTALAGAGIVGLAVAFAFQDIAANFVSGVVLSIRMPIRIGHLIQVKDFTGTVLKINLRDTVIRTFHGHDVIIPNKVVFDSPIINYTSSNKRCIDLEVGVSYDDHLPDVKEVALNALTKLNERLDEQGVLFFYTDFGDSSINFFVRLWLKETNQAFFLETRSQAIMIIKQAFDDKNITIPYPIRTLDFLSGEGEKIINSQSPVD